MMRMAKDFTISGDCGEGFHKALKLKKKDQIVKGEGSVIFALGLFSFQKLLNKEDFIKDVMDPCNLCLGEPYNRHSHKPVYYKPDEKLLKNVKGEKDEEN